ncbi:MAG: 50S ribosomal protein L11 methyltransferase [Fidelibacterota bacterium]
MTDPNYWSVLTLTTDFPVREIVSAYFLEFCLGSIDGATESQYFFEPGKKDTVQDMINNLREQHTFEWNWSTQQSEAWHLAWKDSFKPIMINKDFVVVPDWDIQTKAGQLIRIRPGNAFGTGHHETTFMVLNQLPGLVRKGISVLDVGTGSGILAIGAKLFGAGKVTCIENDASCESNFYENIQLNQFGDQLVFEHADVMLWKDFDYDLILVNVSRNVIVQLLPMLNHTSAIIVITGILLTDLTFIKQQLNENKFRLISQNQMGEWACIIIQNDEDMN